MSKIDWPGLMRAGLYGLRLEPDAFWRLTPAELAVMLGVGGHGQTLDRSGLENLMTRFPDAGASKDGTDGRK